MRISDSNNDSVVEIKVNDKMIKEKCIAIKRNEETMKKN